MRASLELSSRQLTILILVVVIAAVTLILIFNFMDEGKEFVSNLGSRGPVVQDIKKTIEAENDVKQDIARLIKMSTTRYFKS